MVWDHNSTTIVMLSHILDEKDFPQFWPETESEDDYGSFKVKLIQESTMYQEAGGYITTRDFIIQSTQDDYELTCKLIHCPSWPESCGPLSAVFDLIKVVQDWTLDQSTVGPVIVVDRFVNFSFYTSLLLCFDFLHLHFDEERRWTWDGPIIRDLDQWCLLSHHFSRPNSSPQFFSLYSELSDVLLICSFSSPTFDP